jgi:hypothetical protein
MTKVDNRRVLGYAQASRANVGAPFGVVWTFTQDELLAFAAKVAKEAARSERERTAAVAADAARLQWLDENIGRWSVSPCPTAWTDPDGSAFCPGFAFAALGTGYFGQRTIRAAIDAAMTKKGD